MPIAHSHGFVRAMTAAALTLSVLGLGCTGPSSSICVEQREAEDPQSGRHVLTPDNLEYLTDPPTSGPHSIGPLPQSGLETPLPYPIQVAVLEGGGVMIQYDTSLEARTVDRLEALSAVDPAVVIAPGSTLDAPIVATAWTWKLSCTDLDTEALTQFINTRRNAAPGSDG